MDNDNKYLGLDYGESKIGLAIADEETKIAFAFDILKNDNDLFDNLRRIINNEQIFKVVIGISSYKADSKNEVLVKKFGVKLSEKMKVAVEYQEEMFTTKMAQKNIIESSGRGSSLDDSEAARIILQDWLDSKL